MQLKYFFVLSRSYGNMKEEVWKEEGAALQGRRMENQTAVETQLMKALA